MSTVYDNLMRAIQLVASVDSLVGPESSIKCITDEDGNYELTTDALKYLQAIHSKDFIYHMVYDDCLSFNKSYGYGCEEFLFFVGGWCKCILHLVNLGLPVNVVCAAINECLALSINHISKSSYPLKTFKDISAILHLVSSSPSSSTTSQISINKNKETKSNLKSGLTSHMSRLSLSNYPNQNKPKSSFYSRYSRHAMSEMEQSIDGQNKKEMFEKICKVVCGSNDVNIQKLISNLASIVYKYRSIERDSKIPTQNLRDITVETVINTVSEKSAVYDGILVPLTDSYEHDLIRNFNEVCVNMILVNTIAYGDQLPENKDVEIREVVEYDDICNIQRNIEDISQKLKILNISLVVYRGDMGIVEHSKLNNRDIVCVQIKSYSTLFKLSRFLSCPIVYHLKNVTKNDITTAKVTLIRLVDSRKTTTQSSLITRDKKRDSHILFQRTYLLPESCFCSVLLCSRTIDLSNILFEKFDKALKRLEGIFENERFLQSNGFPEKKIIQFLENIDKPKSEENIKNNTFEVPSWISNDLKLYNNIVHEHVGNVFKSYLTLLDDSEVTFDSINYRLSVWRDALKCAVKISNTLQILVT